MIAALKSLELLTEKVNWAIFRENSVLPVSKTTKTPLPDVATSSKGLLQEESDLQTMCTSNEFDPNAYKPMEESGYDFSKPHVQGTSLTQSLMHLMARKKMVHK